MSTPSAALNASSSVRPSAYERMSADEGVRLVRPHDVVDGRHALCVALPEAVGRGRELADQPVEGDERAVGRGAADDRPIRLVVALADVHREALVEPVRREVVRVLGRGVEHEMGQLVRDDDADPRVVDLARRDEREQRPDARDRQPTDVLANPGAERVTERGPRRRR